MSASRYGTLLLDVNVHGSRLLVMIVHKAGGHGDDPIQKRCVPVISQIAWNTNVSEFHGESISLARAASRCMRGTFLLDIHLQIDMLMKKCIDQAVRGSEHSISSTWRAPCYHCDVSPGHHVNRAGMLVKIVHRASQHECMGTTCTVPGHPYPQKGDTCVRNPFLVPVNSRSPKLACAPLPLP